MRHVYQDQTIGGADILNSLADVNIGNPEDGQMLVYDASTQRWRNVTQKSLNDLAEVTDLTNVIATGSTNATGSTIPKGTYFYLNDDLCQAKADIANGATFTLNTNYEVVTAGGLNSLNSALEIKSYTFIGQTIGANSFASYNNPDLKNVRIAGYVFSGASSMKIGIQSIYSNDGGLSVVVKNYDNVAVGAANLTVYYC